MDTHEGVTVSKVSKGHGGLTLILIFVTPNVISTVYVPSGRAGTQKKRPPTHTSTRSLAHTRTKQSFCQQYNSISSFLRVIVVPEKPCIFPKKSPSLFPYNVIWFPTTSSNQLSFQSHNSFLWHRKKSRAAVLSIRRVRHQPGRTLSFANSYFLMVCFLVKMHGWGTDGFFSYRSKDHFSVIEGFLMLNGTDFCSLVTF